MIVIICEFTQFVVMLILVQESCYAMNVFRISIIFGKIDERHCALILPLFDTFRARATSWYFQENLLIDI